MEFHRIWRILADNKWILIWLPIIATVAALGVTYVLPEQYESTALVLVRPFEDIKFSSGGGDKKEIPDFPVNLSAPIDALSKTYKEVINSPAVAMKIVDVLQLHVKKPKEYQSVLEMVQDKVKTWVKSTTRTVRNYFKYGRDIPASPYDLAVEDIEQNLKVVAAKDTYAFDITYRSGNPQEAAAVANMAAKIFREDSSEAYRSESARAREFIEMQVAESHKALEQARAAKLAYENSGGSFDVDSEYKEKLKNLTELENTLAKTEAKQSGRRFLAERTHIKESPDVIANEGEIAELKRQISTLRAQQAAYPAKQSKMDAIALTKRLAEQNYEFFLKRYEEARVRESGTVTEIRIASAAVPGLYPVKPIKYVYAGLSFATALGVAIGWVLLLETFAPRVRTVRDVDDKLGVPVLGAVPPLKRSWWTVGT
ncbi:MAG: GumC family protein [Beijerinckiaceae bacterium]